jgi:hypothetical protein
LASLGMLVTLVGGFELMRLIVPFVFWFWKWKRRWKNYRLFSLNWSLTSEKSNVKGIYVKSISSAYVEFLAMTKTIRYTT